MKKYILGFLLFALTVSSFWMPASAIGKSNSFDNLVTDSRIAIKAKAYSGYLLPIGTLTNNVSPWALGTEVSAELLPVTDRNWTNQWRYPTIGISMMAIDLSLGDNNQYGQLFALYPYLSWSMGKAQLARYTTLEGNVRLGVGAAYFNTLSNLSGSYLSGIFTTGISGQINTRGGYSFMVELGTNSINNADVVQPSTTLNYAYLSAGVRYHFDHDNYLRLNPIRSNSLPYSWMFNFSLTGGYRDVHFVENTRAKLVTFNFNALRKMNNIWAFGGGLDIFYNNSFVQQGLDGSTYYGTYISRSDYFLEETKLANNFRVGVSIDNIINMGSVMGIILDAGIYVYDPIRNAYPSDVTNGQVNKLPFFYSYNPEDEDGWLYFRAGFRVRLVENLHLQITGKTHLYRFEHLAFGLSYAIPTYSSGRVHRGAYRYQKWNMSSF